MKIQLKKAIKHKGQDIFSLDIPLEDLKGSDIIEVEDEIMRTGASPFAATDFSRSYNIAIAAKAAHIPVESLKMMCASDFTKVVNEVRNFLIVTDSENETSEETSSAINPPAVS